MNKDEETLCWCMQDVERERGQIEMRRRRVELGLYSGLLVRWLRMCLWLRGDSVVVRLNRRYRTMRRCRMSLRKCCCV